MVYVKFVGNPTDIRKVAGIVITHVLRHDWFNNYDLQEYSDEIVAREMWGAYIKAIKENGEIIQVYYVTCCGNEWTFDFKEGYISLNGSRHSVKRFLGITDANYWDDAIGFDLGYGAVLELAEYKTSTPPEWDMKWYEYLERPTEDKDKAVIAMPRGFLRKIVPYKNVYGDC